MELSKRLNWIVGKLEKSNIVMDVGTDHGYIPIYLVKNNIASKVIASDINKDPLKKAEINASLDGVRDKIELRLGGGLQPLKNKEAEAVIIAGMGGNLIRDILEHDLNKVKNLNYLILQPAQNPEVLREYLYTNSYEILEEDLCLDEGKYYEIFKVRYKTGNALRLDDIYYEVSPMLLKNKSSLLKEYIEYKIEKYKKVVKSINDVTEHAISRKIELKNKIETLEELLKNF